MTELELADRPRIERAIVGALKDAIMAHGPITEYNVSSAAKRVYGQLKSLTRQRGWQPNRHNRIGGDVNCRECGLPYVEHGLDITLPDEQWLMVHPDDGGVLCGTCIARRASDLPGSIAIRARIEFAGEDEQPAVSAAE